MTSNTDKFPPVDNLVLVAVHDKDLWHELEPLLEGRFRVRRETNGLRAIDVMMLLKPAAVIAETGLPGLSGILLARLINHNKYLTPLPVGLIYSRKYLIEEFWASESGAVAVVPRQSPGDVIDAIEVGIAKAKPIDDTEWNLAEQAIDAQGGPAAAVAGELERQLIGASIVARLGEIEIGSSAGRERGPRHDSVVYRPGFKRACECAGICAGGDHASGFGKPVYCR